MDGMLCSNKFYLIQTQQARRLAASVDSENGPTSDAWHKMNTTVAKAPKSKSAKSSDKESLVKKKTRKSNKDESIYDQDAMDEVQGRTNDLVDSDDEDIDDLQIFSEKTLWLIQTYNLYSIHPTLTDQIVV